MIVSGSPMPESNPETMQIIDLDELADLAGQVQNMSEDLMQEALDSVQNLTEEIMDSVPEGGSPESQEEPSSDSDAQNSADILHFSFFAVMTFLFR